MHPFKDTVIAELTLRTGLPFVFTVNQTDAHLLLRTASGTSMPGMLSLWQCSCASPA